MKIGILGCGMISRAYAESLAQFRDVEVIACADLRPAAAEALAERHGYEAMTVDQLYADPRLDLLINLTNPAVHAETTIRGLEAGKHVHLEKPLAADLASAREILAAEKRTGKRVSCAPDTFLGGGHQTVRKLLDDGWIGTPLSGVAYFVGAGPDGYHAKADFFYRRGGGPIFDVGPYSVTTLVNLLGPVSDVIAHTSKAVDSRIATHPDAFGKVMPVEVPMHAMGLLGFAGGAVVQFGLSWEVKAHHLPFIELYGTEGSLSCPDPNNFGGPVKYARSRPADWQEVPLTHDYIEKHRGFGAVDLVLAVVRGETPRCGTALAFHVLEVLCAIESSGERGGAAVAIESSCERPAPRPMGGITGLL